MKKYDYGWALSEMQILALYYNQLDKAYMAKVGKGSETEEESN